MSSRRPDTTQPSASRALRRVKRLSAHLTSAVSDVASAQLSGGSLGVPFTRGLYGPVRKEWPDTGPLRMLVGRVPAALEGYYLRNGANPAQTPADGANWHWFDGDGMVHMVELSGSRNEVRYVNRYVQTDRMKSDAARKFEGYVGELGEAVAGNLMAFVGPVVQRKNPTTREIERMGKANTSFVINGGRLLALEEGDHPYEIAVSPSAAGRPLDLVTRGRFSFGGQLPARHPVTAHPKVDPLTGELVFFGYRIYPDEQGAHAYYSVADAAGKLLRTVPVTLRAPTMQHDVAVTEHYTVVLDFPMTLPSLLLDRDAPSRFGVLPRNATDRTSIRWFEAPSAFGFHVGAAFEHEGAGGPPCITIVAGAVQASAVMSNRIQDTDIVLTAWTLDLSQTPAAEDAPAAEMSVRVLVPGLNMEFPVTNPRTAGSKPRWLWLCAQDHETPGVGHAVCKYSFGTESIVARHEFVVPGVKGRLLAGECFFVPADGRAPEEQRLAGAAAWAIAEDAGYLMTYVTDTETQRSYFYVVDAATMAPQPVCVAELPGRVPFGFHGYYVSRQQAEACWAR